MFSSPATSVAQLESISCISCQKLFQIPVIYTLRILINCCCLVAALLNCRSAGRDLGSNWSAWNRPSCDHTENWRIFRYSCRLPTLVLISDELLCYWTHFNLSEAVFETSYYYKKFYINATNAIKESISIKLGRCYISNMLTNVWKMYTYVKNIAQI